MKRTLIALSCLVLFAIPAYGQGGILNDNVLRADGTPAIGATVRICTEAASGTPCSPTASIFSDKALTIGIGPTLAVDAAGAYTYYASPGFYKEQICLGATCVTRTVQVPPDLGNAVVGTLNNICYADDQAGADAGYKIAACITASPSTGGIVDARGLEGAQTISSTITVNKHVAILLGYATYTTSVAPAFDFTTAGASSSLIGVGTGDTSQFGTRIIAANGTLTPLVRIQGTNTSTRISVIHLENFTIEGVFTVTQIGLFVNFASEIFLDNVRFRELGQAEDIDDVFLMVHEQVNYSASGSGGTAATATVRVERRSGGPLSTERIYWGLGCIWQGDPTGGNNKQGTAVWVGPNTSLIDIGPVGMDYNLTNPDFPIIHFDKVNGASIFNSVLTTTTITTANGVVEITGDSGTRAQNVNLINNRISTSATVPAVHFDWSDGGSWIGGTLAGLGTGTGITVTVNANGTRILPFRINSLTTALSDASVSTNVMLPDGTSNAYQFPNGIIVGGGTPAVGGLIRAQNSVNVVVQRNAANTADVAVIFLNGSDIVQVGAASASTQVMGTLGVGVTPQARGVTIKNNEEYWMQDAGGALVAGMKVDASDILQIGDDTDLASIDIGAPTVPTTIGGTFEYRDAPTLTASTTPSVTGGNVFLTNSTASITDFTGGQNGQVIILLCGADTTTSLTDSTPLFLAGAFTCTTNDTISLVSNGTVWYETSRGVN